MTDRDHPPTGAAVPFDGDPLELKHLLETESRARPGKWAQRLVRRDVFVAMRLSRAASRYELLIWRKTPDQESLPIAGPTTLKEKAKWEGRVRDVLKSIKCGHWTRGEDLHRDD